MLIHESMSQNLYERTIFLLLAGSIDNIKLFLKEEEFLNEKLSAKNVAKH